MATPATIQTFIDQQLVLGKKPNWLLPEKSPYLLQHAFNPVAWFPWGEEAFALAGKEGKPIFLSIGYSTCHWCHVMAHESFENPEVARLLNENFVCIKVDREERPDLDQLYMTAVQALTGHGGWPMSVFLTPDLRPFYGGTYFPPEGRHGLPGFAEVLAAVHDAWDNRPEKILESAANITAHLRRKAEDGRTEKIDPAACAKAFRQLAAEYDAEFGGFGRGLYALPDSFHRLNDGDELRIGDHVWRVVVGSGHSPEHACLYCPELKLMISGDQVLPKITTNVSVWFEQPWANPLGLYLDSLRRFEPMAAETLVLPSHGRPFRGLHARLAGLRDHHDARLAETLDALAEPRSAAALVPLLFQRELDTHQLTFALGEALAHLHFLEADGRVRREVGEDGVHRFTKA